MSRHALIVPELPSEDRVLRAVAVVLAVLLVAVVVVWLVTS